MKQVKQYIHQGQKLARPRLVTVFTNQPISSMVMANLQKAFTDYSAFNVSFYHGDESSYPVEIIICDGQEEAYEITISQDKMIIKGTERGIFYASVTLLCLIKDNELYLGEIKDEPTMATRGYYYDVTRGRIPTLDTLKALVDDMVMVKANHLQLYIEHSFLYQEFPEISAGMDGLSALEIKELDDYCARRYVELVPSIASFGHLYHVLKLPQHQELCELDNREDVKFSWIDRMNHHTVNTANSEAISFIEGLLKPFMGLFRSKKFNICADETFDLGKGKSKELVDSIGEGKVYLDFLVDIMTMMEKKGYQVMFWGDILLKHPEEIGNLPKDVICLNWLYAKEPDENKVKCYHDLKVNQILCPAVWGWNRMVNNYDLAIGNIKNMLAYTRKYHAQGFLVTDWGDYGHINPPIFSKGLRYYSLMNTWCDHVTIEEASKAAYGHEKVIALLTELSKGHLVTWLELTWWQEHNFNRTRGKERYLQLATERIQEVNDDKVSETDTLLNHYLEELLLLPLEETFCETLKVAVSGIKLFNETALAIANKKSNPTLGTEWLWWYDRYRQQWLQTDRHSELPYLHEAITNISSYLKS